MGIRSALRELFRPDTQPVMEAAPAVPPKTPERAGYEYGMPRGGINEIYQGLGAATGTDRRATMQELYESYLACPWSWSSVNAIARTITAGGLVTDWDGDNNEGDQEIPDKPDNVLALERLLAYCNPREDVRQLMRGVIADLLVFGDAYIEVVWIGKIPVALYSLDSPSMYPIADEHGNVSGYVQVTDYGQRAKFDPRDVIHISLDSPRSGIFGVSPTQANLLPITAWMFAAATAKEIFRKGNPPAIHVDFPQSASQPELNRWDAMYATRNIGPRNIGVPIVTKGGATVKELKQGSIEEYLHFLDQKRDEILAGYGVPPAQVGVIESGNLGGGTGESQRKMFLTNTCQPIAELVLEKLNFHISRQGFGVDGWHLKFADVDLRDSKTIEEIRDMRLRNGSWTLDRYRTDIGEPPVPGGNQAVLVDRQNLVPWVDLTSYSRAIIAMKLKGTTVDMDEPQDDQPVALHKQPPPAVPAPIAPLTAAVPGDGGELAGGGEPQESAINHEWRAVSRAWTAEYERRRRVALENLPVAEHRWHPGDLPEMHDHHDGPDYEPADLGVSELHRITIPVAEVNVDHAYQRPLDPARVALLAAQPRQRIASRVGLIARRPDGTYWIVDGQHHTAAARADDIQSLTYQCFPSTGPAMEKRVYEAWQMWDAADHPRLRGAQQPVAVGAG